MSRTTIDWEPIRAEVKAFMARNQSVFIAGGELLSRHFAEMQKEKGIPEEGYTRRPVIGLRIQVPRHGTLAAKPGYRRHSRYADKPGQLLLNRVELELLADRTRHAFDVTEDGASITSFYANSQSNLGAVKYAASALWKLIDNPTAVFEREAETCACCGRPLSVITSRLRGIGPECIRYFSNFDQLASEVKEKYRDLDSDWRSEYGT